MHDEKKKTRKERRKKGRKKNVDDRRGIFTTESKLRNVKVSAYENCEVAVQFCANAL